MMVTRKPPIIPERIQDPRSLPFSMPGWCGDLPHLTKEGCSYFVTFCEIHAVPLHAQSRRSRERERDPDSIALRAEPGLYSGLCFLRRPAIANIIQDALLHFQAQRYDLHSWCVMPNHVHAVVTPYHDHHLSQILHSWKSFTSQRINKVLRRSGVFWESESFDHLIRNTESYERFVRYTELNPVKAGLCAEPADWPFSSARWRVAGSRCQE